MSIIKGWECEIKIDGITFCRHKGVEINQSANKIDITTVCSQGHEESCKGIDSWSTGTIEMIVDAGDTVIPKIQQAFDEGTILTLIARKPNNKTQSGDCWVSELNTNYPFDEVIKISFKLQGTGTLSTNY